MLFSIKSINIHIICLGSQGFLTGLVDDGHRGFLSFLVVILGMIIRGKWGCGRL